MTRKAKAEARKVDGRARPCAEVEDGKNFGRFDGLAGRLLNLAPEDAYSVRMASQPRTKPPKARGRH